MYTPGNPKRERKITKDWWDRAVLKATTQDDIIEELEKVKKDDPKFWLRLIYDSIPKHIVSENNGLQVNIILNGIEEKRVIQGRVIQDRQAIGMHHNVDTDE